MTDQMPVLRARTAPVTAGQSGTDKLQLQMQVARLIAKGGPEAQAFLTLTFAEQRDLDLLTCMQGVSFVHGRPVIDATLQRALAKRAGYRVVVKDATTERATVEVHEAGELLGSATYTIDEARTAGLAGKDNWKKNPKAMLVARATTQAMRWFAPDVMTGLLVEDEAEDLSDAVVDPVDTLAAPVADVVPLRSDGDQGDGDVVDAEVVEDRPTVADVDGPITAATKGKATAAYDLASTSENGPAVKMAMQAEGIPLAKSRWTERQGLRVIELCETTPAPDGAA